jgi:hypothetical protein
MGDPRLFVGDQNGAIYVYTQASDQSFSFTNKVARANGKYLSAVSALAQGDVIAGGPPTSGIAESALFVFRPEGAGWTEKQELLPTNPRLRIGFTIAYDGQSLAAGSPVSTGSGSGAVYLYERSGGTWLPTQTLTAPAQAVGLVTEFGLNVAFGAGVLAVTSGSEDQFKGAVYFYARSAGTFSLVQRLSLELPTAWNPQLCFVGDTLLAATQNGLLVIRKEANGWARISTLDAPPGFTGAQLACDGKRVASIRPSTGVAFYSPTATGWTTETLPLDPLVLGAFALRNDTFFASDRTQVSAKRYGALPSEPCTAAAQCVRGFCVDGVCCDSACGGGDPNDCQACSVAAGAVTDGTCAPIAPSRVCRPSRGSCDVADRCDGVGLACQADTVLTNGTACERGGTCAAGVCSAAGPGDRDDAGAGEGGGAEPAAVAGGCAVSAGRAAGGGATSRVALAFAPCLGLGLLLARSRRRLSRFETVSALRWRRASPGTPPRPRSSGRP